MPESNIAERIVIIAPVGRDGAAMAELLQGQGFQTEAFRGAAEAAECVTQGAGTLLLTEEALELGEVSKLFDALNAQPAWSQLPLILLTSGGESRARELLEVAALAAGSVTLLERPMSSATLLRSVEVALHSRRRQYQVRELLEEQQRKRAELETARARVETDLAALMRMHELSRKSLTAEGLERLLQEIMEAAVAIAHAQRGTLQLLEGDSLRIVAQHGHRAPFLEFFAAAENRASVCGEATKRGERVVVPDVEESPIFAGTASLGVLREAGVRAVQSTPLMDRTGVLLGVLTTQWERPYRPDEHDLRRIDLLARQGADMIEHARAEKALRESQERMRLATEATGVGIWEWNVLTNQIRWDAQMFRIYGAAPTADGFVPYTTWSEAVLPEDLPQQEEILQDTVRRGANSSREFRIRRHGDKQCRNIQSVETVRTNTGGKVEWVVGTNLDVTERKQAEEVRARLAAIVESSEDAIVSKDLNGVITSWNAGAQRLFGYTAQEAVGQPVAILIPPERFDEEPTILERIRRGESVGHFESVRRRKDGTLLDVLLAVSPVLDHAGRVVGASKIARDITERKQAEAALRESEERFRTLAENIPQLAWMADEHGWLFWYNRRWFDYTGTTLEEMQGWGWQKVQQPEYLERVTVSWKRGLQSGEPWEDTFQLRSKTGEYRWFLSRAFPIRDANGKIKRWFGTNTDITQQKNFEAELERLVAERTTELQATNEQLEAFVYSIAHDLRAPLRSMMGYSQVLVDEYAATLEHSAQQMLKRIQASSEFMDKLLLDLLAFGRAARVELELGPVEVQKAWDAALFQCATETEQHRAQIETVGPLPRVHAHEATLTQCLANLLSNSLKFVAPGVRPSIRFRAEDRGSRVRLWVEDNGIGIPPRFHERVFRVFERLQGARYPGTGIGLSIVRKGIERMGGEVGLESEPGKGSRFWLELQVPVRDAG